MKCPKMYIFGRKACIGHLLKHPIVKFRICELPKLVLSSFQCVPVRYISLIQDRCTPFLIQLQGMQHMVAIMTSRPVGVYIQWMLSLSFTAYLVMESEKGVQRSWKLRIVAAFSSCHQLCLVKISSWHAHSVMSYGKWCLAFYSPILFHAWTKK